MKERSKSGEGEVKVEDAKRGILGDYDRSGKAVKGSKDDAK